MATHDRSPTDPFTSPPSKEASGWAVGGVAFATCVLGLLGVFQIVAGLTALIDDDFYVVTANYTFDLDMSVWGCVHLFIGVVVLATAGGLFAGAPWAGVSGVCLATFSALVNFLFIPYHPVWAVLLIVLNAWVIWSLTRPGVLDA